MLTRAQGCRVDDQRGLLTKEQLEVPLFLQVSSEQTRGDTEPVESSTTSPSAGDSKEEKEEPTSLSPSSATAAETEPKDLKETAV